MDKKKTASENTAGRREGMKKKKKVGSIRWMAGTAVLKMTFKV